VWYHIRQAIQSGGENPSILTIPTGIESRAIPENGWESQCHTVLR
jgi:hypothetical protein